MITACAYSGECKQERERRWREVKEGREGKLWLGGMLGGESPSYPT